MVTERGGRDQNYTFNLMEDPFELNPLPHHRAPEELSLAFDEAIRVQRTC